MEIESSLLGPEIDRIINKEVNNNTGEVTNEIIIHTTENDITMDKIISVDVSTDYNTNYADEIYIELLCPMGDLVKFIYPYRNNLEISIIKVLGGKKELTRYKLVLNNISEKFGSGKYKNMSLSELNKQEAYNLKGQAIDRNVEAIRLKSVEGIFRDHTVSEVLVGLMHTKIKEVKINGQGIIPYINMVQADNERLYKHITIPSATKLVDLPTLIQETDYGVYNGHIGLYITLMQKNTPFSKESSDRLLNVFMYPLYRVKDIESANNKLIIYNVPNIKYSMIENTYIVDGDDLRIISSEDSKKINEGDDTFIDNGIGYVSLDANSVMNRPVEVTSSKVNNEKENNNLEYYMKDRADGSHYRQHKDPSDNQYEIRSEYLKAHGDIIQVKWNFSNTKYLLPGMAVVYTFLGDNNNVVRLNGILQSHYTVYNQSSKMASTVMNIFIEKDTNEIS